MRRFPEAVFGVPGSGPKVFRATDFPKNAELRLPIGVAGFTLLSKLRNEALSVRLYGRLVAVPAKTPANDVWLELAPPPFIAAPPRTSSLPVLPPPRVGSPKVHERLMRTVTDKMPGPSR